MFVRKLYLLLLFRDTMYRSRFSWKYIRSNGDSHRSECNQEAWTVKCYVTFSHLHIFNNKLFFFGNFKLNESSIVTQPRFQCR